MAHISTIKWISSWYPFFFLKKSKVVIACRCPGIKARVNCRCKKEILSFLNTDGGSVVIGVKDDGEILPITDNAIRDIIDTTISSWIQEAFYPRPYNLIKHYYNADDVMVIEIQGGNEIPYYLKEKGPKPSGVYKRVGRSCRQASEDEILSMIMESKG